MTLLLDPEPLPARHVAITTQSVPGAALTDRTLAQWVCAHGLSVIAGDDHDLDLIRYHRVRPIQVVLRCGPAAATIRRAVDLGVTRFIATTAQQLARLAQDAGSSRYIYLDEAAPLLVGDRRLKVVGLHTQVDGRDWGSATGRLVARARVLRDCGCTVKRLVLSGGSFRLWQHPQSNEAAAVLDDVDRAVRTECQRWRFPLPAVTLAATDR